MAWKFKFLGIQKGRLDWRVGTIARGCSRVVQGRAGVHAQRRYPSLNRWVKLWYGERIASSLELLQ
jgi:hypothetical protein